MSGRDGHDAGPAPAQEAVTAGDDARKPLTGPATGQRTGTDDLDAMTLDAMTTVALLGTAMMHAGTSGCHPGEASGAGDLAGVNGVNDARILTLATPEN
jgi:hypothetical protein